MRTGPTGVGQPLLLQAAKRDGCCRVAAQEDKLGAASEEVFDAILCVVDDVLGGLIAVGHVGVVGEIDEVGGLEPLDERAQHGQSAEA